MSTTTDTSDYTDRLLDFTNRSDDDEADQIIENAVFDIAHDAPSYADALEMVAGRLEEVAGALADTMAAMRIAAAGARESGE